MPIPASIAAWPTWCDTRDRVLQATPNALTKRTVAILGMLSTGVGRKPLRTTIVAAMDVKTDRRVYRIATIGGRLLNGLFRANIRWQTLAEPFLNYCDGVHTPLFEEFATGVDGDQRHAATSGGGCLPTRPSAARFAPTGKPRGAKIFHRDLADMWIVSSPIAGPGGQVVRRAGRGRRTETRSTISWTCWPSTIRPFAGRPWSRTTAPAQRQFLFAHDTALPGFNDSGRHARNMAFQDGGLANAPAGARQPGA